MTWITFPMDQCYTSCAHKYVDDNYIVASCTVIGSKAKTVAHTESSVLKNHSVCRYNNAVLTVNSTHADTHLYVL